MDVADVMPKKSGSARGMAMRCRPRVYLGCWRQRRRCEIDVINSNNRWAAGARRFMGVRQTLAFAPFEMQLARSRSLSFVIE